MVLIIPLGILALAIFALAMAQSGQKLTESLQQIASGIPVIGGGLSAMLRQLEHALAWAAGQLYQGLDAMLGAVFGAVAKMLEWTFQSYKGMAVALLHTAQWGAAKLDGVDALRARTATLEREYHGLEHGVKTLNREYHGIDRELRKIERELGKGIGNDVRVQIKALEREVTGIEKRVIPNLRTGIQTAEGETTQLQNFIKAIPGTRYLDWAAGIVTAAVGLEIFNLFKCPSLLNSAKNRGCGLWNGLEDILSLFFDAGILIDLCKIIPTAVTLFGEVEQPLTDLISGAANAACAQMPADWVEPMVAAGPLPPAQTLGPLAAG